jgi:hypothetical protein
MALSKTVKVRVPKDVTGDPASSNQRAALTLLRKKSRTGPSG